MDGGETLVKQNAMAEEEFTQRKQHALQARERYNTAVAQYELLTAGAWEPDKRCGSDRPGGRTD